MRGNHLPFKMLHLCSLFQQGYQLSCIQVTGTILKGYCSGLNELFRDQDRERLFYLFYLQSNFVAILKDREDFPVCPESASEWGTFFGSDYGKVLLFWVLEVNFPARAGSQHRCLIISVITNGADYIGRLTGKTYGAYWTHLLNREWVLPTPSNLHWLVC